VLEPGGSTAANWGTNSAVHLDQYALLLLELGRRDEALRQPKLAQQSLKRIPLPAEVASA
jgi:hypothetical protein